jgi:hypothetical protein
MTVRLASADVGRGALVISARRGCIIPNMLKTVSCLIIVIVLAASRSFAVERPADIPSWLQAHVGEGEGQIAPVVLQRARALYFQKVSAGLV